jgi:hypothetical protein
MLNRRVSWEDPAIIKKKKFAVAHSTVFIRSELDIFAELKKKLNLGFNY